MSVQMILLPLFVQVLLTFLLLFWMGSLRVFAVQRGEVRPDHIALRVLHALVHVTSNHVPTRGGLFILGAAVLTIMWGMYMLRILLAV